VKLHLAVAIVAALAGAACGGDNDAKTSETPTVTNSAENEALPTLTPAGLLSPLQAAVDAAPPGQTVRVSPGVYKEMVRITKPLTLLCESGAVIDGEGIRDNGIAILQERAPETGQLLHGDISNITISGCEIRNTREAAIIIGADDDIPVSAAPHDITIQGNNIHNFDCTGPACDHAGDDDHRRAGVASWFGGRNIRVLNNTIIQRSAFPQTDPRQLSATNGIYFLSTDSSPSGGGHVISGNLIVGGWDGIGGEDETVAHGTFDRDFLIEDNIIVNCADDGIQVEGGGAGGRVRRNDISLCATGIAFAPPVTGPLNIEENYIHDLQRGDQGNLFCFKVGGETPAVTNLVGNRCIVDSPAEQSQGGADGIHQTNEGLSPIVSRGNVFRVSRYVFEIPGSIPAGMSFDEDCISATDPERFIKWSNDVRYESLASFRQGTGQELKGRLGPACD